MIRDEVIAEQARIIQARGLTGSARVTEVYPGEKNLTAEMVFANGSDGAVTFPYAMAGQRIQIDTFQVLWVVRITATKNVATAKTRRNELVNEILLILADADGDLLAFSANGEEVRDTSPDGQPIQVTTREGDDPKTGRPIAIAEITCPFQTQTINAQEG